MYDLTEHIQSTITSICIDKDNTLNAATGCQNGIIYVWNLFTGDRIQIFNKQKG